ncbi:MAG: hypothetical protein OHK0048_26690 [Rhodoferax sp.]
MNTRDLYSRFVPVEEIDAVQPWRFGDIETAAQRRAAQEREEKIRALNAHIAAQRKSAFDDGYAQGVAAGRAQAQDELQRQMQAFLEGQGRQAGEQLAQLLRAAQEQIDEAQQAMAQQVLALACQLARQILRREIQTDTQSLLPVLREALAALGADCKAAVVRLNPEDLVAVGPAIQAEWPASGLTLRPDESVVRGGCVVESAGSVVDASLPRRWERVLASLGQAQSWTQADHDHD